MKLPIPRSLDPWFWIKKILPRSLFGRSLLIIVVPVLLLQVVTTLVFVDNHWRKITSRLAFAVAGEIAIIADDLEGKDAQARRDTISRVAARKLDLLVTYEPDKTLEPYIRSSDLSWRTFTGDALADAIETQVRRPYNLSFSPEDKWVNIGVQMDGGVLRVLALERRLFSTSAYIFLSWQIGLSVILFAIAAMFMRGQIRPIRKLAIMAERMGKGQPVPALKPEGAREVRAAISAFGDMYERITRQVEQRTAMLAGISHDLRTPLTRMKLGLSLMGGEDQDVAALKQDVADMERMVESYISFVRGEGYEETKPINLFDLLNKLQIVVLRHGKHMAVECPPQLYIHVRPISFERCLSNIINNAEKYASHIWVSTYFRDGYLFIDVDDDGPGISPALYEDVFKPFYRADTSRNADTGGVGLGLPIVRDIVHAHGGEVILSPSPHAGLRVSISIPT
jgi:two-component system osmolarity sensor histidine kinase EnvZ